MTLEQRVEEFRAEAREVGFETQWVGPELHIGRWPESGPRALELRRLVFGHFPQAVLCIALGGTTLDLSAHRVEYLIKTMQELLPDYTVTRQGRNLLCENEAEDYANEFDISMLLAALQAGQLEHYFIESSIFVQ